MWGLRALNCEIFFLVLIVPAWSKTAAPVPPMGWSTWTTFKCNINETLVLESIEAMSDPAKGLGKAGYNYVLIDDCWAAARNASGAIQVDKTRFPRGFEPVVTAAHSRNLKIGIYTAVGAITCAGFTGSLGHEAQDAASFHAWGFDFVKHDTCVDASCTIRNGCIQNATQRMRDALLAVGGGHIVYYLDAGNPTNEMKLYNPRGHHVPQMDSCIATSASQLAWRWAANDEGTGPHIIKAMWDIKDTWFNTLMNLHALIRVAPYHQCGQFLTPDMLTVGMGGQTLAQYRAQFYLWGILGAPLILSNDVRNMDADSLALVTNEEVISINQDPDCVMGSLVASRGTGETWIRPLSDGSFAAVLLNKDIKPANVSIFISKSAGQWGDFFPVVFKDNQVLKVRDVGRHEDLGVHKGVLSVEVGATDAVMLRMTVVEDVNAS